MFLFRGHVKSGTGGATVARSPSGETKGAGASTPQVSQVKVTFNNTLAALARCVRQFCQLKPRVNISLFYFSDIEPTLVAVRTLLKKFSATCRVQIFSVFPIG